MIVGQHDDGLATFYNVGLGASPGHIQYNGIGKVGVRFDSGASGINESILVRSGSTLPQLEILLWALGKRQMNYLVTIGSWSIQQFGPAGSEESFVGRLRSNAS